MSPQTDVTVGMDPTPSRLSSGSSRGVGNAVAVGMFADRNRAVATFLIVAMLPLQFLGLDVATTKVDLSNIVFIFFALSVLVSGMRRPVSKWYLAFFVAFLIVQLALFIPGRIPLARFISGCSWIFSILIVYGWRRYIVINTRLCYLAVLGGAVLLALTLIFEMLVLNIERPAGTMAEPSPAGLVLLATAAGLLISSQWVRKKSDRIMFIVFAVALVYLSYVIHSTHILSFAIALLIAAGFSRTLNASTLLVNSAILAGMYFVAASDTHYVSRVDVGDAASNLSLLAWLQGFDQMRTSLRMFPLTGAGLGGTGSFGFISEYSDFLYYAGIPDLNLLDAYSGFFRLMIEAGPIFMIALAYAIGQRLRNLWRAVKQGLLPQTAAAQQQVFLFVYSLTLIIGIMLKEPTYSRSQMVVGALLFFCVPLGLAGSNGKHSPAVVAPDPGAILA